MFTKINCNAHVANVNEKNKTKQKTIQQHDDY